MKTKIFLIFLFLGLFSSLRATTVSSEQAQKILKNHFINLTEIRNLHPDAPSVLIIPFSQKFLEKNRSAWLVPVKIKSGFKYFLVRANFENEFCALKGLDTLDLKTARQVVETIKRLRPDFPERIESNLPFKYFFRTAEPVRENPKQKKAISYNDGKFIVVSWPNEVELGVVNKNQIFYLTKNRRGVEIQFETTSLPENCPPITEQQSILVMTLFSCRE